MKQSDSKTLLTMESNNNLKLKSIDRQAEREDLEKLSEFILRLLYNTELKDSSVQDLIERFHTEYPTTLTKFRACNVIVIIMQTSPGFLETTIQKVAATALLMGAYGKGPESLVSNPFASMLYALLKPNSPVIIGLEKRKIDIRTSFCLNDWERSIISRFIEASAPSQVWNEKLSSIVVPDEAEGSTDIPQMPGLIAAHIKQCNGRLPFLDKTIPGMFLDSDELLGSKSGGETESIIEDDIQTSVIEDPIAEGEIATITLKEAIHVIIPKPPLHISNNELVWLQPSEPNIHKYEIDPNASFEVKQEETVAQKLIKRAFKEALSISQRQALLNELQKDPKIAQLLGVTPVLLPDLVENNPIVAIDVLLKLMELQDMKHFLSALISMDMSVHSMEVVNRVVSKRLTSSVELPAEFLYLYISNCIKTCEGIQDKYVQNRLVRLLCVFLQSLIRNQIIDFQFLYIEILTFCVEFSRIREAAALYRLMKQVESENEELREILLKKLENHQHLSEAAKNFPNISKDKDSKL